LVRFIVVMYVDHFAFTGNFLVSSMRVFHALSAGKIVHPPIDGGGPAATQADPPPLEPVPFFLIALIVSAEE
jgi:hypothetical protein